jgi:hypothetical protein
MTGSWINHRLNNEAEELRHAAAPLMALYVALVQVHNVLLADQAIARMLQNSTG